MGTRVMVQARWSACERRGAVLPAFGISRPLNGGFDAFRMRENPWARQIGVELAAGAKLSVDSTAVVCNTLRHWRRCPHRQMGVEGRTMRRIDRSAVGREGGGSSRSRRHMVSNIRGLAAVVALFGLSLIHI